VVAVVGGWSENRLKKLEVMLNISDWIGFVGKILTGNHRFSHEDHGAFL
jgi:hypothetical protein